MAGGEDNASVEALGRALKLARQINDKVENTLIPLKREMTIARWPPEFQKIIWESVALTAQEEIEKLT